ncbi:MAG: ThuA domain-containing protein [Terriglobales bacterium]
MLSRRKAIELLGAGGAASAAGLLGARAQTPQKLQTPQAPRSYAPGSRNYAQMGGMANPRRPGRKNVLAWGDVRNGFQHDSVSHAFSVIEELGYNSKIYDTYIRTDSQPITKHGLFGSDGQAVYGHDLRDFDAIFFFGVREIDLTAEQRADLMSFIHDDGKAFIAAHAAATAFMSWPEFGAMLGGRFANHPWGVVEAPVIVEDRHFPATSFFPPAFLLTDEMYQIVDYSRRDLDVLLRLDTSHLNLHLPSIQNHNGDFPLAWAKRFGKGRVFYSAIGHARTTWDIPDIQRMYFEAILWGLGLNGDPGIAPHPERPATAPPVTLPGPIAACVPDWARKGTV